MYNVDYEPIGRRGLCSGDVSLLDSARDMNVDIVSICGGVGSCGRCVVQIIAGKVSKPTLEEEAELGDDALREGYRMACHTYPLGDVTVRVPPESLTAVQRTQVEGLHVDVPPAPAVRGVDVILVVPTLHNPLADDVNLWAALGLPAGRIDYAVQRSLADELRAREWQVCVALRGDEIIAVGAPGTRWLGLAVDIGTTKIAAYLLDLESGSTLASRGLMNPQIAYGEDVVARIVTAGKSPEDGARMQKLLTDALSQMTADLCSEVQASPAQVVDAVVVANTAIHHLFLGLPVRQLGQSPYLPASSTALDVKARELNLKIGTGAYVHLLPNIAGYVGADHVAMLLATRIASAPVTTLAIDIGTNTEICLNHQGRLTSISCASGPAFEGAHIRFGMRAAPGAIEHVRLTGDKLEIQVIGAESPVGLCGSGLLDVVAQLRINNVINRGGKMGEHARIRRGAGGTEFILAERPGLEPISVSQKDVRELQLAKAAIRLGIQALVEAAGLQEQDLQRVIIAGAFGTFIDVQSAVTIGMFPPIPLERYEQVGNAAGTGARLALASLEQRSEAQRIAGLDGYIELGSVANFSQKFSDATFM